MDGEVRESERGERVRPCDSRLVRSEKRTDGFGRTFLKLCRVMIG